MKKLIVISSELQSFVYFVDCELRRMKMYNIINQTGRIRGSRTVIHLAIQTYFNHFQYWRFRRSVMQRVSVLLYLLIFRLVRE